MTYHKLQFIVFVGTSYVDYVKISFNLNKNINNEK